MQKQYIATLADSRTGEVDYHLYTASHHVFRIYPDKRIGKADEEDKRFAEEFFRLTKPCTHKKEGENND